MKSLALLALLAAPLVEAHYIFNILYVNGKAQGGEYAYVRKNSNSYQPSFPADIVDSNDLRCNHGARAGGTKTFNVNAGDKIALKVFNSQTIAHPGPGFVYMSKAPGAAADYDGSGDWFKVYEVGLCGTNPSVDGNWCSWYKDRLEFTMPKTIPPGEYLVRFEQIGLHEAEKGRAQFYVECTQLKVEGPGGGEPGPMVKIPGVYTSQEPGLTFNKWNAKEGTKYPMPGPAVWTG